MCNDFKIPLLLSSAVEKVYVSSNLLLGRIVIYSALLFLNLLVLQQGNVSFTGQSVLYSSIHPRGKNNTGTGRLLNDQGCIQAV